MAIMWFSSSERWAIVESIERFALRLFQRSLKWNATMKNKNGQHERKRNQKGKFGKNVLSKLNTWL